MLVYDVSSRESFDNVRRWLEEIRQKRDCVNIILVGNKSDLKEKAVDAEEATAFADEVI
jgi:GTPase SAR1 family protein